MRLILSKLKAAEPLFRDFLWFFGGFLLGVGAVINYYGYPPTIVFTLGLYPW